MPLLLAIAGGSASGKTLLAQLLKAELPCEEASLLSVDQYYHDQREIPFAARVGRNYDDAAAFDFDLLVRHLTALKEGHAINAPTYDYPHYTRAELTVDVRPSKLLILEGLLALHDTRVRALCDYSVFVETSDEVRLERRLIRDVNERGRTRESALLQWRKSVLPMHQRYCQPSQKFADEVIVNNTANCAVFDSFIAKIHGAIATGNLLRMS